MFLKTIRLNWKSIERSVENAQIFRKNATFKIAQSRKKYRRKLENILN